MSLTQFAFTISLGIAPVGAELSAPSDGSVELSAREVQQLIARHYDCPGFRDSAGLVTTEVLSGTAGDAVFVSVVDFEARRWRAYSGTKPKNLAKPSSFAGAAFIDGIYYYCSARTVEDCDWKAGFPGIQPEDERKAELATYLYFRDYLRDDAGGVALKLLSNDNAVAGSAWKLEMTAPGGAAIAVNVDRSGRIIAQEWTNPSSPFVISLTEEKIVEGCELPDSSKVIWRGRPELSASVTRTDYEFRSTMTTADTAITVDGVAK